MAEETKWSEEYLFEVVRTAVPDEYEDFLDWYETMVDEAYSLGAGWANMCMLLGAPQLHLGASEE